MLFGEKEQWKVAATLVLPWLAERHTSKGLGGELQSKKSAFFELRGNQDHFLLMSGRYHHRHDERLLLASFASRPRKCVCLDSIPDQRAGLQKAGP